MCDLDVTLRTTVRLYDEAADQTLLWSFDQHVFLLDEPRVYTVGEMQDRVHRRLCDPPLDVAPRPGMSLLAMDHDVIAVREMPEGEWHRMSAKP